MNRKLVSLLSAGALALAASGAQADIATPVPSTGSGTWTYTGPGTLIDFGGDTVRSFTSGGGVVISVDDCCVVGDAFGLILDGTSTPWTSSGFTGAGGLFEAYYTAAAGAHTFSFDVTADCCGSGLMYWKVASAVPEPETYAMMLAGLGLLGFAARRRKQKLAA